ELISQRREVAKFLFKVLIKLTVCHFDEGEIFARSSTKIGFSMWSYLWRFLLRRNDIKWGKIILILIICGLKTKTLCPSVFVAKHHKNVTKQKRLNPIQNNRQMSAKQIQAMDTRRFNRRM